MTTYTPQDLSADWEFKILRANYRAFRHPDVLRAVLEQEAAAGWQLVEKFDDARLRFKRPRTAKEKDAQLPIDAYRTQYGISEGKIAMIIIAGVLALVGLILGVVASLGG
jgi:hypothetical protein